MTKMTTFAASLAMYFATASAFASTQAEPIIPATIKIGAITSSLNHVESANVPGAGQGDGQSVQWDEKTPTPSLPDDAATVAVVTKSYVVTAVYDGKPFKTSTVVMDTTGLVYQVGSGAASTDHKPRADGDVMTVRVVSLDPVVFDIGMKKGDANAAGNTALDLSKMPAGWADTGRVTGHLSVDIERLADETVLRADTDYKDGVRVAQAGE